MTGCSLVNCLTDQCCGSIQTPSGVYTGPYCIPIADGNGQTSFNIGPISYKGLCQDSFDYICVAGDPNNKTQVSECAPFDYDGFEHCCAVKTSTPDGSYVAGTTGVCENVLEVDFEDGTADANGEYTVCFAITLLSGIASALSLF